MKIDSNEVPQFQDHAFDRALDGRRPEHDLLQLTDVVDGDKISEGRGFQIKTFRATYTRPVPDWARTKEGIQKILLTAFPRLRVSLSQRQKAGRWAKVINLYFINGWSTEDVAEEMYEKRQTIMMLTRSIVRVSQGLRADGSGTRSRLAA
jgi:hypothetical protein